MLGSALGRSAPLGVDGVFSPRGRITHRVRVHAHLDAKRTAMAAHGSQRRAEGQVRVLDRILRLPRPLFALAFGTEWYVEQGRGAHQRFSDVFATVPVHAGARGAGPASQLHEGFTRPT